MVAIELRPSVNIDAAYPHLDDLAVLTGPDKDVRNLSRVVSNRPVLIGHTVKYFREDVEKWVLEAGLNVGSLQWHGARRISVSRRSNVLSKRDIEQALEQKLAQSFKGKSVGLSLVTDSVGLVQVPRGPYSLLVKLEQRQLEKSMSALVSIVSNGRLVKKIRVNFRLKLEGMAVVATDDLPSHTLLTPNVLSTEKVNTLSGRGKVAVSQGELLGKRLIRPVTKGQVIVKSDVESVPEVIKSETLSVVFIGNGVSIKMRGVALEDGRVGETIMVTLPTSDTPMPVIVVGKERGQIQNGA
ncbi:flagellar basal body P-ring formation chaperone FlgA [Microbulbifer sp. SAOS-129_SWC]|uniref:flagellar basal body P-ring formation chaperone FlgA n=1 Tax=Microbulbifer sp. SAOS-129_SWC TaxID=3145235 RepID=UPI0032165094